MSANETATPNGTQLMPNCFNPTVERVGKTVAFSLLLVVSLVGNIFVGIVFYKTKTSRKPTDIFILNMAMSDLLYPFIYFWDLLYVWLNTGYWLIGDRLGLAFCKMTVAFLGVSSAVSIQSLVLITVDRFGAVVYPFSYPLIGPKLCRFFILAFWIIAVVVHCPELIASKLVDYPEGPMCERRWNETFGKSSFEYYIVTMHTAFLYVPLASITILYIIIALKVRSQKIPGEQSVSAKEQRLKRERNILRMSIAIVCTFAICWLPLNVWWLLSFYSTDRVTISSCGFEYFTVFVLFCHRSYCAINPCICFIFSGNYRQALKNVLSRSKAAIHPNT